MNQLRTKGTENEKMASDAIVRQQLLDKPAIRPARPGAGVLPARAGHGLDGIGALAKNLVSSAERIIGEITKSGALASAGRRK